VRPFTADDTSTAQEAPSIGLGIPGGDNRFGIPGGAEIGSVPSLPLSPTPKPPARPLRRSESLEAALLVHRLDPVYPALARQIHLEGTVQLHAIIGRDGTIQSLEVLSGHPLLIQSALDAVRQWRYRPTLLNGEAVEVETSITVIYVMHR
jgi:protein TonB